MGTPEKIDFWYISRKDKLRKFDKGLITGFNGGFWGVRDFIFFEEIQIKKNGRIAYDGVFGFNKVLYENLFKSHNVCLDLRNFSVSSFIRWKLLDIQVWLVPLAIFFICFSKIVTLSGPIFRVRWIHLYE